MAQEKLENKAIGGLVLECKQETRNGVDVGIVEGYIATWDLDRGDGYEQDQFVKGAFRKSIREHKRRGRQARFKDGHGRTVGGWPAEYLKEDDRGLFGVAEINIEVQQGRDAYLLAKQGVLTDFSVGFTAVKFTRDTQKNIRTITEAILWEGSIVDEPMNPEANVTQVKTLNEDNQMDPITEDEVKDFTKRDFEEALRSGAGFTKKGAKLAASLFDGKAPPETEDQKAARVLKEAEDQKAADAEAADEKNLGDALATLKGLSITPEK